MKPFEYVSDL